MRIPRILLAAGSSGAGKTLITCTVLQCLKDRGKEVTAFKCGPDYIDPMFHKKVLGIDSYNLDTFLCGRKGVRELLFRHGKADIAVMEGVMGYYDGLGGISPAASAWDVADASGTPAVLIVDCKGASLSLIPYIQGFLNFKGAGVRDSHIRGIILNRMSQALYNRMKELIEGETDVKVYGYVPVIKDFTLESRHLGLKMPEEIEDFREQVENLAQTLEKTLDIDGILELAESAEDIREKAPQTYALEASNGEKLRIGLARDEAFCFMYQDNLELLKRMGAELVTFSPIHSPHLPGQLDGLLFYGGYPELYAEQLSVNKTMLREVREAVERGLPCIAECGGFMYLMEALESEDGAAYEMAGVLPGKSCRTPSLRRFGYLMLEDGTVFGEEVGRIPAHEFHYYDSEDCGHAFTAKKPLSERRWECMISTDTLLAGYPHLHYTGNPKVAEAFLDACKRGRNR